MDKKSVCQKRSRPTSWHNFCKLSEISTGYTLPETKNIFKFEVLAQILRIGTEFVPFQNGGLVPEHRNHPLE